MPETYVVSSAIANPYEHSSLAITSFLLYVLYAWSLRNVSPFDASLTTTAERRVHAIVSYRNDDTT